MDTQLRLLINIDKKRAKAILHELNHDDREEDFIAGYIQGTEDLLEILGITMEQLEKLANS